MKSSWLNDPSDLLKDRDVSHILLGWHQNSVGLFTTISVLGLMGKVAGSINDIKPAKEM